MDSERKQFFSIGEVCELTGLEAHILRFWESEFKELRPRKTAGGTRRYSLADLEMIQRIQHLVHVEQYTLAGARRRLRDVQLSTQNSSDLRAELREILDMLLPSGRSAVRKRT